jgi:Ran GTPase-activating protein (RanGAP) involved in mRNA processing and transport
MIYSSILPSLLPSFPLSLCLSLSLSLSVSLSLLPTADELIAGVLQEADAKELSVDEAVVACEDILAASVDPVTVLDLNSKGLGDDGLNVLSNAVMGLESIEELRVGKNECSVDAILTLVSSLTHCPSLKVLDIHGCKIGDAGVVKLAPQLSNIKSLTHLQIGGNDLTSEGLYSLAPVLALLGITQLHLSHNKLGDSGVKELGTMLADMKSLTHISLGGNDITPDGVSSIANALVEHLADTLVHLDLSDNEFSDDGVANLVHALPKLHALSHLNLSHCEIEEDGEAMLIEVAPAIGDVLV